MKSVLEDLYFGETRLQICDYVESPRLKKAVETLNKNEEILLKLLDGKEKTLFIDFINAQGEVDGNSSVANFVRGFKLGARIVIESISEEP